jgi:hypothetical protein
MPSRVLLTRGVLPLCALFWACAQTAVAPPSPAAAISAYYRLPGQAAGPYPYKWLVLDPPLSFAVDAAGSPHLIAPVLTAGSNIVVTQTAAGYAISTVLPEVMVRGDVPMSVGPMTWQLSYLPSGGVSCFRNGLYQSGAVGGVDYTRGGIQIVSESWAVTDALRCDYETVPPPDPPAVPAVPPI